MPVLFQAKQSQIKDKNGKKLYYPRVVRTGTVTTDQISKEIAAYSSLTTGDVKNTIDNLITVMSQHLQASESVSLDGLGIFRTKMKSYSKGAETPEEVSASQSSVTVGFLPSSTRNSDRTVATRSMVTGVKCVRFEKANAGTGESGDNNNNNNGGGGVIDPTM